MTQVDALLQIASAIKDLAGAIGGIGFTLVLFLLFKNMGGTHVNNNNNSGLDHISDSIDKLANRK